jgi:hypothetical protein
VVWRDDDADGDDGANTISFVGVVDEVAADRSATVGDEAADVAVHDVAAAVGPKRIWPGSRRTPPALMVRRKLSIARSIRPRKPEKAKRDANACGGNMKDSKKIDSSKISNDGCDEVDSDTDVAGMIGTTDDVP